LRISQSFMRGLSVWVGGQRQPSARRVRRWWRSKRRQESWGRFMRRSPEREWQRNRIGTTVAQRLAARQPPHRQHAAARGAEARDRNARVVGTAGIESAARSEQRTQDPLVGCEQGENQSGHKRLNRASAAAGKSREQDSARECSSAQDRRLSHSLPWRG